MSLPLFFTSYFGQRKSREKLKGRSRHSALSLQ